jgi:hypothetical protein
MSIDDIRAAWEAYHGPDWSMGYLPDVPPTYSRGYRDGRASVTGEGFRDGRIAGMHDLMTAVSGDAAEMAEEIRAVLAYLENLAETWGDDDQFRTARDRLRALL